MAYRLEDTINWDTLSRDPNASVDVLQNRKRYLQDALARNASMPNPDPQTLTNIASFQSELSDLGERIGKHDTNQTLDLFKENSPVYNPTQDTSNINEMFNTQQDQQSRALNEMFNTQRGNAIDEAAALGNLRQPTFQSSTLNNIDAMKGKAMQELFANLGIGRNEALINAGNAGRNYGLNRAGAMAGIQQGGEQFGKTLGFNQEKFGAENTLAKRQQDLNDLFRNASLAESVRNRQASEPGLMDKIQQGFGIANSGVDTISKAGKLFGNPLGR